jgi:predicted phage terminase large subunit-like protein
MSYAIFPDQLKAELCRRSFKRFIIEFWDTIVTEPLIWNWHMDVFCIELERVAVRVFGEKSYNKFGALRHHVRLKREYDLLATVPPGTTKSLIFSIFFHPWCWTNDPTLRFIVGSYASVLSLEHSDIARDLIKSQKFMSYYPSIIIKKDKDNKGLYTNNYGGGRYSTSVGGAVIGFHAHIIIVDDPVNPRQAASPTMLKTANTWMKQTLSTRKVDKAVTPTIVVMQRLNENDPAGVLIAGAINFKRRVRHICLPGEIFDQKTRDSVRPACLQYLYVDGVLDPVRMGRSVLKDMNAELGQYGYAGQVLQSPSPPGGGMFKTIKLQIIPSIPISHIVEIVRYWDKAGTSAEDNSAAAFTAGVKMARLRDSKWLYAILDVKRDQLEAYEREELIKITAQLDGKKVKIWTEQEPGSGGKESAQATVRNLAGFSIYAERPTGDKIYRADPYSVQVNWGNVVLVEGPWNQEFIEEHGLFPNGKRKDQVDAAAGAFNKLAGGKKAGTWGRQ